MTSLVISRGVNETIGFPWYPASSGAGDEARLVDGAFREAARALGSSETLGRNSTEVLTELLNDPEIYEGVDGLPMSTSSLVLAARFLTALPHWISAPEALIKRNGNVAIEWYHSSNRQLMASFDGRKGLIYFSGLLGPEERVARAIGYTDGVPKEILDSLVELGFVEKTTEAA